MPKRLFLEIAKMKGFDELRNSYSNIDMKKTGVLVKDRIEQAGYSVKEIQELLLLSCPQPIYRWFNGKILPSVEIICSCKSCCQQTVLRMGHVIRSRSKNFKS